MELKEQHLMGRGFPHHLVLERDDNLTSFYTGLPSYNVLMFILSLVVKAVPETINAKLSDVFSLH